MLDVCVCVCVGTDLILDQHQVDTGESAASAHLGWFSPRLSLSKSVLFCYKVSRGLFSVLFIHFLIQN